MKEATSIYKKFLIILMVSIGAVFTSQCQSNPFSGSSRLIKKEYGFKSFSKLSLINIDGEIEVITGDSFKVEVKIREKYLSILTLEERDNQLEVKFNYTKDNNKYINDPRIKIRITCPSLVFIDKKGNADASVFLRNGSEFTARNEGNGSLTLKGSIDELTLFNDGNGTLDASDLKAKSVAAVSFGNGNILVRASDFLIQERNGNGRIIQKGTAKCVK